MATASVTHTFIANTLIQSSQANTNFGDLVTFLNGSTMHRDASSAFTAVPSGPATDPSSDNQLTRKRYVDVANAACVLRANGISIVSGGVLNTLTGFTAQANTPASYFTTATDGITVTQAGWYEFSFLLEIVGSPVGGEFAAKISLDAVQFAGDSTSTASAPYGLFPNLGAICFHNLTAGQKVTLQVGQNTGTSRTVFGWLWLRRVAAP